MKLYLVQHGNAFSKDVDPQRGLTEKGRSDVEQTAAFLEPLNLSVCNLWHSGKTRAVLTAEILAGVIKSDSGIIEHEGLGPNDDVAKIRDEVVSRDEDIMIVGHLPFLDRLASLLIAGSETTKVAVFQQGGVVCLESSEDNVFAVCWMVTPGIVG